MLGGILNFTGDELQLLRLFLCSDFILLSGNLEMVDDLLTFEELDMHLKSEGCDVAKLSSMDFAAKNGVGGCLRGLLRQFVMPTIDNSTFS